MGDAGFQVDDDNDPATTAGPFLSRDIDVERYAELLDRYVPSSKAMLTSMDEHPDHFKSVAQTLREGDEQRTDKPHK